MAKKNRELFTSLPLDPNSSSPLHRQLYEGVRDAILRSAVPTGTRLPSTRTLAAGLGVSRNTVMTAFEQLLAEGYVEGRHGSGTYVWRLTARVVAPRRVPSRANFWADRGSPSSLKTRRGHGSDARGHSPSPSQRAGV